MKHKKETKKTVVVLGVARSGTSTIAGMLQIIGVDMGEESLPSSTNPKGDFEDPILRKINTEICKAASKSKNHWDGSVYWKNPPSHEQILKQKDKFDNDIKSIIQEKSKNRQIWGWKFPATNLTIELFFPHLIAPHFVVVFRNPLNIVNSAQEFFRVRKIKEQVDFFQMFKAVNYHNKETLNFLEKNKNLPGIFVSFEDTVNNPIKEAKKLADFLGLELTEEKLNKINRFVLPRDKIRMEKKKASATSILFRISSFIKKCLKEPGKTPDLVIQAIKKRLM